MGRRNRNPDVTDSGLKFLRMARQVLDIPQNRILSPEDTLKLLLSGKSCPVVFLDDFVGSGHQFLTTWEREFLLPNFEPTSFKTIASVMRNLQFFYCPLVCTEIGRRNILSGCSSIKLNTAHLLTDNYSALAPKSVVWPPSMCKSGPQFVESVSARAKINGWQGFHGLGLSLAFEHSVPDATLPLFYWNENGWKPLIKQK